MKNSDRMSVVKIRYERQVGALDNAGTISIATLNGLTYHLKSFRWGHWGVVRNKCSNAAKYKHMMDWLIEMHEDETNNLKKKQVFMVIAMFIVFSVMMSTALTSVTPDFFAEEYDSDDHIYV